MKTEEIIDNCTIAYYIMICSARAALDIEQEEELERFKGMHKRLEGLK